jgi:endonuclease III
MTPDPGHIAAVQRRLRASQGPFVPKPRLPIVDEVVATVLSQHTSDHNSERAFAQLKARFPGAVRLGWIPPATTADQAYHILSPAVPPDIRYDLHLALIGHGRAVCSAQRPRCAGCVLLDLCPGSISWAEADHPLRPAPGTA